MIQLLEQLYPSLSVKIFTACYLVILLPIHHKNNEQMFVFVGRRRDVRCERRMMFSYCNDYQYSCDIEVKSPRTTPFKRNRRTFIEMQ